MVNRMDAMNEYIAAVNEHDQKRPETKDRVRAAKAALKPHLDKGRLPDDLYAHGKKNLKALQ